MDPIDYSSTFNNIPSPNQAFMQGVQGGAAMQQLQVQQQQAAAGQQRKVQMQADMSALSQNPTTQAIGAMSIKYPELSEQFKRSFDMVDPAQKQSRLDHATQVYAALHNGAPDVAQQLLGDQAAAARNSGNEAEAQHADTMAALVKEHPQFAQTTAGLMLSSALGPDKFAAAFPAIGGEQRAEQQAPADLMKKQADARKAGADAAVAVGTVPALIQKPVEENLSAVAKRRVDDLNVQIGQADSETKRGQLVLERDKFIAEQGLKAGAVGTDTQNQMDGINDSIDLVKKLKIHPGLVGGVFTDGPVWGKDAAGIGGVGTTSGKILSLLPGSDATNFRTMVETLKSKQFLTQAKEMKGMGALSDAEGARIERAVASLDTSQSMSSFQTALGVIQATLEKGQAKLIASGKLPKTGGAFVVDHPVLGKISEGDINRLLTKNPGSTREQVIQYLSSVKNTGGASGNY